MEAIVERAAGLDVHQGSVVACVIIMATLFGMALGGWMSGAILDLAGSYRAAFANGVLWNGLNLSVVLLLLARRARYYDPQTV